MRAIGSGRSPSARAAACSSWRWTGGGAGADEGVGVAVAAGLALIAAGLVNLVAGFLGLFPALFEAAASGSGASSGAAATGDDDLRVVDLLATPYGRYALANLLGAFAQMAGGSWIAQIVRAGAPLVHALAVLAALSLGSEVLTFALKGSLSALSAPGLAAAGLVAAVWGLALRRERAGGGEDRRVP